MDSCLPCRGISSQDIFSVIITHPAQAFKRESRAFKSFSSLLTFAIADKAVYSITDQGCAYFEQLMAAHAGQQVPLLFDFNVVVTNLDKRPHNPEKHPDHFVRTPFWVGLYERIDNGKYEVCKITFGAEPKDYEVYDFLLRGWRRLSFSPPIAAESITERKMNPKRMRRQISRQLDDRGIGTKAQQTLKLQHKQNKIERKTIGRAQKEMEKERQFALRQEKKKARHRGK